MPMVVVGEQVKGRLDEMLAQMKIDRGRRGVTLSEVIEALVAEHDQHRTETTP